MNAVTKLLKQFMRHITPGRLDCFGQVHPTWTVLGEQQSDKNGTETSACKINRAKLLEICDVEPNWTVLCEKSFAGKSSTKTFADDKKQGAFL